MPFTFSHPAIVIPIKKKLKDRVSLTGLVLGSMAPDFEYFLRFKPLGLIGHTYIGFILLNLPICFMIAFIYHNLIKDVIILNLPSFIRDRYINNIEKKFEINTFEDVSVFIISCFIGMLSHIFWDSFTHNGGYFVDRIGILSEGIHVFGFEIFVYKILQHMSTMIGFFVILMYLNNNKNQVGLKHRDMAYKLSISKYKKIQFYIQPIIIGLIFSYIRRFLLEINGLGGVIVTFINGVIIAMIFQCIYFRIKNLRNI